MNGSRSSHTKNWSGCSQCKKWHKRCDLVPPRCGNCRKRKIVCQFEIEGLTDNFERPALHPLRKDSLHKPRSQSSAPDRSIAKSTGMWDDKTRIQGYGSMTSLNLFSPSTRYITSDFPVHDAQLLHHYLNFTAFSIAFEPQRQYLWRFNIAESAKECNYVKHNLLALAAAHQACIRPSGQQYYRRLAAHHQMQAINQFRSIVKNISEENCYGICASAGITIISELACSPLSTCTQRRDTDSIEQLLDVFRLVQKVIPLWRSSLCHMKEQTQSQIFVEWDDDASVQLLPPDVKVAAERLEEILDSPKLSNNAKRECCVRAFLALVEEFKIIVLLQPPEPGQSLRWSSVIEEQFLELLKIRYPIALAILAMYCVLLNYAVKYWYFQGWAERVLTTIRTSLDRSWASYLELIEQAISAAPTWYITRDNIYFASTESKIKLVEVVDKAPARLDNSLFKSTSIVVLDLEKVAVDLQRFQYRMLLSKLTGIFVIERTKALDRA